jgi:hypothetical protein
VKRSLLVVAVAGLLGIDAGGYDIGVHEGLTPIDVGADHAPSAARCADCHPREHDDWQASRHAAAWSNDLMQQAYLHETQPTCVNCHAPLPDQGAEIAANAEAYRTWFGIPKQPEPHADEGISCAVCHWREGQVLAAERSGAAPHRVAAVPEIGESSFCAGCHQFRIPTIHEGAITLTDTPMQSTWDEWVAWRDAGGTETCQGCHMPGGRHVFQGAHDVGFLKGSVEVEASPDALVVTARGVGHHVPSGDLFRHLTLEVQDRQGWRTIATFGRTFAIGLENGLAVKRLATDTALRPDQPVVVPIDRPRPWRLRYCYARDDEADCVIVAEGQGQPRSARDNSPSP